MSDEYRWTINNMLKGDTEPGHFEEDERQDPQEDAYQEHLRNCDDRGYHVDGCFYCGGNHPSDCCTDPGRGETFSQDCWRSDPHWDIEDTEGFEAYRTELKAYREQFERAREKKLSESAMNWMNETVKPILFQAAVTIAAGMVSNQEYLQCNADQIAEDAVAQAKAIHHKIFNIRL